MSSPLGRRYDLSPLARSLAQRQAMRGGRSLAPLNWPVIARRLDAKRRHIEPANGDAHNAPLPPDFCLRATWASFRLDGIDVGIDAVRNALAHSRPSIRTRQAQRLRNHAAILRRIEGDLRSGLALNTRAAVRWYTAISSGLTTTSLDRATESRIDEIVRQVNSPQPRTAAAIQEVATVYAQLLSDPLVPSFNGILARLLMRFHLGRCRLPAVVFNPEIDAGLAGVETICRRLIVLVEESCDQILAGLPQ